MGVSNVVCALKSVSISLLIIHTHTILTCTAKKILLDK